MSEKNTQIARWRDRLGLSQRAAAAALGMSLSGYQEQERGAGFDGRPRKPSHVLLLACAAIEAGLEPIEYRKRPPSDAARRVLASAGSIGGLSDEQRHQEPPHDRRG